MAAYSFKKEASVYVVYGGLQYLLDISEINFSQTIQERSYEAKTIQSQLNFEASIIDKANPANFEVVFPALREADLRILFDRALDIGTFDLYISTQQDVFKIEYCVITNGMFIIEKLKPLSMKVSGEASKLSRAGDAGVFSIPGTPQARSGTRTYNRISDLSITLGGSTTLSDDLISVTIELQNNIKWVPYQTVPEACGGAVSELSYPSSFSVDKRVLAGSIRRYLTDTNNADLLGWSTGISLLIFAGQSTYGFELDMPSCSFTNRLETGEVYTQSYDWRMIHNPTNLSDVVTYTTA